MGIRKTGRLALFAISLSLVPLLGYPVLAQDISNGAAWLEANQDPSGFWGVRTPFRDATVVVGVLSALYGDSAVINKGAWAVNATPRMSSDYLGRKIIALSSVNDRFAPADLEDSLSRLGRFPLGEHAGVDLGRPDPQQARSVEGSALRHHRPALV